MAAGIYYRGDEDIFENLSEILNQYDKFELDIIYLTDYLKDLESIENNKQINPLKDETYDYLLNILKTRISSREKRISMLKQELDNILIKLNDSETVLRNLEKFLNYKLLDVQSDNTKDLITKIIEGFRS